MRWLDVSTQELVPDQNYLRASIHTGNTHSIPKFSNISLYLSRVVDIKEYNMHHICTCRFSFSISKSSSKAKSVSQYFSSFIRTCSNTLAQYSGMMSWRKASSKCLRCSLKFVVFANRDAQ